MKLVLIRHGPTEWNVDKRIQGSIDNPLSQAGIEQVSKRKLSAEMLSLVWYTSPLRRARQTAQLMG
ncbi:MAG: histidine phosphatase family protein, partial [Gammaproteobacteria bacterium]